MFLKNEDTLLPLKKDMERVTVIEISCVIGEP